MTTIQGERLYVRLGSSQVRRRLKGRGFGVRKVASVGRGEAVIFHTATGQHLRELRALFQDVLAELGETAGVASNASGTVRSFWGDPLAAQTPEKVQFARFRVVPLPSQRALRKVPNCTFPAGQANDLALIDAAGYVRCSTDQQVEASIPAQKAAIRQWASANGYSIIAWYEDAGISGWKESREAFQRLIDDAEKRKNFKAYAAHQN